MEYSNIFFKFGENKFIMSATILSIKNGISYMTNQRDKTKVQNTFDYYQNEINRLERKLYVLEVEYENR